MPDRDPTPASQPQIIVLVRDLMFSSRILAAAAEAGSAVRSLRDAAKLPGQIAPRLIVDLNQDGFLEAAAEWKRIGGAHVIGFVSHVDTETIARAKSAGIDQIFARSQFVQRLPQLLAGPL